MATGFPGKDLDKRRSRRYPAWIANGRGELQIGERRLPVRLLDQSAGGYAVLANECPGIRRGDVIQLHVEVESFEMRVTYVGEESSGDPQAHGMSYRIGLERVKEFLPQERVELPHHGWLAALLRRTRPRYLSSNLGVGLILAAVVACAPLVVLVLFQHFVHQASGESAAENRAPEQTLAQPDGVAAKAAASGREPGWADFIRLPGASGFLVPSVIRELALTEAQQQQMRRIAAKTEEAFRGSVAEWERMSRQGRARSQADLLKAARKEAIDALTPEQRLKYEARASGSTP